MDISQFFKRICQFLWQTGNSYSSQLENQNSLRCGEVVIDAISKRFRKRSAKNSSYSTIKTGLIKARKDELAVEHEVEDDYFYALKDVSFHIEPGSALGVIGRNGSGKSTLLKLISGIYLPDGGSVQKQGRISALIELGAGFHPDFSGRENIYLGGVMYGLSKKEIDAKFDDIVEYAELQESIDDPVRTYSSGMYMRLGFSLAIHTDPDILLIDEVLAVGDAAFIAKCHDSISEMKRRGKTLIFVTHDLPSVVRWCDEVAWMASGVIKERGEPRKVIDAYLAEVEEGQRESLEIENERLLAKMEDEKSEAGERWGSKDVEIFDVALLDSKGNTTWLLDPEQSVVVEFRYRANKHVQDLVFGVGIERADGLQVHGTNTAIESIEIELPTDESAYPVEGAVRYSLERVGLVEGSYFLDVAAHRDDGYSFDYHHRMHKFSVRAKTKVVGVYAPKHSWQIEMAGSSVTNQRKVA